MKTNDSVAVENKVGRNLTPEQRNYLIGKQYQERKQSHGGDRKSKSVSSGHFDHLKTAEQIAQENKVKEKTVRRAAKFTEAVDAIAENVGEKAKHQILNRDVGLTA